MSSSYDFQERDNSSTSSQVVSTLSSASEKASKSLSNSIYLPLKKQVLEASKSAQSAEFDFFKLNKKF